MKRVLAFTVLFFTVWAPLWTYEVKTRQSANGGWSLLVDGKPIFVKGVVWSPNPVGTTFTYNLWKQSDAAITALIDLDAPLMVELGVNAIRVSSDIPAKWVEYFYTKYHIYTIIVDPFGRNGVAVAGRWFELTNFELPKHRKAVLDNARATVEKFKNVPGVLMYMFGNENNYRLYWPDTPMVIDIPGDTRAERRSFALYGCIEEAMKMAKQIDPSRPVGLINGDLGDLDIVAEACPSLDILGSSVGRGAKLGQAFYDDVQDILGKPVLIAQMGADAWNARLDREDQYHQAQFIMSQWTEMYGNAYGAGASNAIGGCVNEWTDQWWTHNPGAQTELDVHNTEADWLDWAYYYDVLYPYPNVNPEWGGITSQGDRKVGQHSVKHPRAAYYALQYLWSVDPVQIGGGGVTLDAHLARFDMGTALARGIADSQEAVPPRFKVSTDISFSSVQSGNSVQKELKNGAGLFEAFPSNAWGAELRTTFWGKTNETPAGRFEGSATLLVRHDLVVGEPLSSIIEPTTAQANPDRPFDLYSGWFTWKGFGAEVNGYYHNGHADWAGQGDFFGFVPETYALTSYDEWGSKAPVAVEGFYHFGLPGEQGLAVLGGPEPFPGSGPLFISKWFHSIDSFAFSALYSQGFSYFSTETQKVEDAAAKASLWAAWEPGGIGNGTFRADFGVLASNWQKIGEQFKVTPVRAGLVNFADTLAVKGRMQYTPFLRYFGAQVEVVYAGIVADTYGGTARVGSLLTDIGTGNRFEVKGGITGTYDNFQLQINALWRKPLIPPLVKNPELTIVNPFSVGGNREALQIEAILSYDAEPGSWLWAYNNADNEGAVIAASLVANFSIHEGPTDPGNYKDNGLRQYYPLGLPDAEGLFSFALRTIFNPLSDLRIVNQASFVRGQPVGGIYEEDRIVTGFQDELKVRYQRLLFSMLMAFNTWGPESWQREQNMTYPMRWAFELGWSFKQAPSLLSSAERVGLRWKGVIRDRYSANWREAGRDSQELELFFNLAF